MQSVRILAPTAAFKFPTYLYALRRMHLIEELRQFSQKELLIKLLIWAFKHAQSECAVK